MSQCDRVASMKRRLCSTRCCATEKEITIYERNSYDDCYNAVRSLDDTLQATTKLLSRLLVQKCLHDFEVHGRSFSGFIGLFVDM